MGKDKLLPRAFAQHVTVVVARVGQDVLVVRGAYGVFVPLQYLQKLLVGGVKQQPGQVVVRVVALLLQSRD